MSEILHQKKNFFLLSKMPVKDFVKFFFFTKKFEKMFARKKIIEHIRF